MCRVWFVSVPQSGFRQLPPTARKNWNAERYYTDENYYMDQRTGAALSGGHGLRVLPCGPKPAQSAIRPGAPGLGITGPTVGAQYLYQRFACSTGQGDDNNVIFQLLHTGRPGTFDTSLVSTDNIVDPRTMNAVYNLNARMTSGTLLWP